MTFQEHLEDCEQCQIAMMSNHPVYCPEGESIQFRTRGYRFCALRVGFGETVPQEQQPFQCKGRVFADDRSFCDAHMEHEFKFEEGRGRIFNYCKIWWDAEQPKAKDLFRRQPRSFLFEVMSQVRHVLDRYPTTPDVSDKEHISKLPNYEQQLSKGDLAVLRERDANAFKNRSYHDQVRFPSET